MKKQYTAEEKKEYFKKQKDDIQQALLDGVAACYTEGNFKNYLDTISKFHDYSLNNCLLIALQKPEATYVAGYNDWQKKFKRHVKSGEKGIRILAPMPKKFTVKETDKNGNETNKEINIVRFKMISVFDVSQTEGEELPDICKSLTGSVEGYDSILDRLIGISQYPVTFEKNRDGCTRIFQPEGRKDCCRFEARTSANSQDANPRNSA